MIDGLRSLIIDGWELRQLAVCFGVIAAMGAVLTLPRLRAIRDYDR